MPNLNCDKTGTLVQRKMKMEGNFGVLPEVLLFFKWFACVAEAGAPFLGSPFDLSLV